MFKTIWKNIVTTVAGCFAGLPILINGISTHNIETIISGAGIFLLGLFSKDAHNHE